MRAIVQSVSPATKCWIEGRSCDRSNTTLERFPLQIGTRPSPASHVRLKASRDSELQLSRARLALRRRPLLLYRAPLVIPQAPTYTACSHQREILDVGDVG